MTYSCHMFKKRKQCRTLSFIELAHSVYSTLSYIHIDSESVSYSIFCFCHYMLSLLIG